MIVGALGSKLGTQLVLGSNNTGVIGYGGNLIATGLLWFLADKVMKNKTAASGIIAGGVAQLILRMLNDFTPVGSWLSQAGMGDYQAQSFVAPQILTDPTNNSNVRIPSGWGPGTPALPGGGGAGGVAPGGPAIPAAAVGAPSGKGMGGSIYDGGGLY